MSSSDKDSWDGNSGSHDGGNDSRIPPSDNDKRTTQPKPPPLAASAASAAAAVSSSVSSGSIGHDNNDARNVSERTSTTAARRRPRGSRLARQKSADDDDTLHRPSLPPRTRRRSNSITDEDAKAKARAASESLQPTSNEAARPGAVSMAGQGIDNSGSAALARKLAAEETLMPAAEAAASSARKVDRDGAQQSNHPRQSRFPSLAMAPAVVSRLNRNDEMQQSNDRQHVTFSEANNASNRTGFATAATAQSDHAPAPPIAEIRPSGRASVVSAFTMDQEDLSTVARPITAELAPTEEDVIDRVKERLEREFAARMERQVQDRMRMDAASRESQTQAQQRSQEMQLNQEVVPAEMIEVIPAGQTRQEASDAKKKTRCRIWALIIGLTVLIGGGIGAGIALSGGNDDSDSGDPFVATEKSGPTESPTAEAQTARFETLLQQLEPILKTEPTNTDRTVLEDRTSFQYMALDWMANDDRADYDFLSTPMPRLLERYVLAVFYFSLTATRVWWDELHFLSGQSVCDWNNDGKGVFCDDNDREVVVRIEIEENRLVGNVPKEIALLSDLEMLDLSNNQLTGTLHTEFGYMTFLNILWLSTSRITGSIPTEMGLMARLQSLDLDDTRLVGNIPTELGQLSELVELYLSFNGIGGRLPSEIGLLTELVHLDVYGTNLEGTVPVEWSALTNLVLLSLEQTDITGNLDPLFCTSSFAIATFYSDCVGLNTQGDTICSCCTHCCDEFGECYETGNGVLDRFDKLVSILVPILRLSPTNTPRAVLTDPTTFQYQTIFWLANTDEASLDFDSTNINIIMERYAVAAFYFATGGSDGTWIDNFNFLSSSSVCGWSANNIGIECDAAGMVDGIDVGGNGLRGSIPRELFLLSMLKSVRLEGNNFDSSIPSEIGLLTDLEYIDLTSNVIRGTIPTEIGNLVNLKGFVITQTLLEGALPSEIGNMQSLQFVSLHSNSLSGQLPYEMGNLALIEHVALFDNRLTGTMPEEWSGMSSLTTLEIEQNLIMDDLNPIFCTGSIVFTSFWSDCAAVSDTQSSNTRCECCTHCCNPNDVCAAQLPPEQRPPTPSPTSSPTAVRQSPRFEQLYDILEPLLRRRPTYTGESILRDQSSVQFKAIDWMANVDGMQLNFATVDVDVLLERYALVVWYYSTGGPDSWSNQYGFLSSGSVCTWTDGVWGVTCNNQRVIELAFKENGLTGTIPQEFCLLSELEFIQWDIHEGLIGTIPTDIGMLTSLSFFSIEVATITGTIPTEVGRLSSMKYFYIEETTIGGTIPTEFGRLQFLQVLDLSTNLLDGLLPSELGQAIQLSELLVFGNDLTGTVPSEWGGLRRLTYLDVESLDISGNLDPIFCNAEFNFEFFYSDCFSDANIEAEVTCTCCTHCCFSGTCINVT